MPRRNRGKGRRPQAQRGRSNPFPSAPSVRGTFKNGLPQKPKHNAVRSKLLPMVETTGVCPHGKLRYGTADDAQEALRRAIVNREILQSPVVEDRWYPQEGDAPCVCQGYHLTHSPRRKR